MGLWCATAAALLATLIGPLAEAFAVLLGRSTTMPEHSPWPMLVAAGMSVVTLAWQHYLVPVFASSDVRFTERRTPGMMLRNYWISLWMPLLVATIIVVTNFIPVYMGRHPLDRWLRIQPWILYVIAILPVLLVPPLVLMWPVRRHLQRNARRQQRCFECGYHLLGVWSSECPECGTTRFDIAAETAGEESQPLST